MVTKSAVVGIDIGAHTSYVAYVGKGVVDLVQNEVSQRATSSLVGFTQRERLLGDAALAQVKSNSKNSCRNFKHLLGRKVDSDDVQKEHFWSTSPLVASEDGYTGYSVNYKGEQRVFSATQITAMYLTKLREVTEKWCQAKVADVVISVPSDFTDVQRQALLDAASIAGMSVLRLMNEHTATALAYGIYRSNDFDPEKPMTVAFCSLGHSVFSVTIVQFVRGKLQIICEKSDKVGGRDMIECLMKEFGAQFEKKHGMDPMGNKKSAFKMEEAVLKTMKTLSANSEAPVNVECLMEDYDFASNVMRDDFEKMCAPMMDRVKAVLDGALAASGMTTEQIDSVEIIGGACRVPWFKKMCSEAFGGKELSTTMNADESVARGCALQAAILSPLYKVRDFKVEDTATFGINVGWMGSSADAEASKDGAEEGDVQMGGGEGEYKTATVFPAGSAMNLLKMLTFYRKAPFEVKAEYSDPQLLKPGIGKDLGTYKVELPTQPEAKKVKVKAKLSLHGTFQIESATLLEEEEYEETVKEKKELPAEEAPASPEPAKDGDEAMPEADGEAAEEKKEKKEPEKKYEWIEVVKKKKRTKRTDLKITTTGIPGLPSNILQKQMDEEGAMQADMREIIETDEKRNDLEGYILTMRDKIAESGTYGAYIASADREKFSSDLMKAEDWLYDNFDATKMQYVEKLEELKLTGDVVAWRAKEDEMRTEWIAALTGTINNYRSAASTPGDRYGHIAAEKLATVVKACGDLEAWLTDMKAKQEKVAKHEKPVLICADMEKKNQELARAADEVLKEPKPKEEKPKEEEKKEEDAGKEAPAEPASGDGPSNMDVD
mmetsp:Transcript_42470/g.99652  ORF Transcript_42470/g.99652 Transcript_42470/m.99652 type:complete len:833 (-) Transcript_42470:68-2566(-)|eukprot:CAMPEP_0178409664 /NCGR_PEP_ID=MMETSP0689_2-20121128/20577_1 /TAXON_ID=160604 /ORGANISM="Amphidinium massartii, Strain CS-259" /LENGTH=832 /DNA_ID=CAMNT_0020030809 /DNA_START=32 /DNA_END=2530 /DNA_ORIENTATION=+